MIHYRSRAVSHWRARMRYLIPAAIGLLLVVGLLLPRASQSQPAPPTATLTPSATPIPLPTLDLTWEAGGLRVVWTSWEPGCLYLVGNLPNQRLADIPCATSGNVLLRTGGVDQAYAPQLRTHVEVRKASDSRYVMAGRAIPAQHATVLPIVVTSTQGGP